MSDVFYAGMADPATALYALKSRIEALGAPSLSSAAGPQGLKGRKGPRGNRGPSTPDCRTQGYGSGPPTPNKGNPGDYYFDMNAPRYYGGRTSYHWSPWLGMFLLDNFNSTVAELLAAHTSDSGHTWTNSSSLYGGVDPSKAQVLNGALSVNGTGGDSIAFLSSVGPFNANYYVEVGVHMDDASGVFEVGLRYESGGPAGYNVQVDRDDAATINANIFKYVAGSGTNLGAQNAIPAGLDFVLRWQVNVDQLTLLVDGAEVLTATDSVLTDADQIFLYVEGMTSPARLFIRYIKAGTV